MAETATKRLPSFPDNPTTAELQDMAHDCISGLEAIDVIADRLEELIGSEGEEDRRHCEKMATGLSVFAKLIAFRIMPIVGFIETGLPRDE